MNREQEISIADLLAACVRKGRQIIVFSLIVALLAGGYKYYSEKRDIENSAKKTLKIDSLDEADDWRQQLYDKQMEDYTAEKELFDEKMAGYDLQLANMETAVDNQRKYLTESELFKLDPYNTNTTTLFFRIMDIDEAAFTQTFGDGITPVEYVTDKIVAQYQSLWKRSQLNKSIKNTKYSGIEDKYLRELVVLSDQENGIMKIEALGDSGESSRELAEAAFKYLNDNSEKISSLSYTHAIELVDIESVEEINDSLKTKQEKAYTDLESKKTKLAELKEEIKEIKKGKPGKPKKNDGKIDVKKEALLGFAGAFAVSLFYTVIAFIVNGKIHSSSQISRLFGYQVLGTVYQKNSIFEKAARSMMGETRWKNKDAALSCLAANADMFCRGCCRVLVVSTRSVPEALKKTLADTLNSEERVLAFADDFAHNPQAPGLMEECDGVIVLERPNYSKINSVEAVGKLAEKTARPVCGAILY